MEKGLIFHRCPFDWLLWLRIDGFIAKPIYSCKRCFLLFPFVSKSRFSSRVTGLGKKRDKKGAGVAMDWDN